MIYIDTTNAIKFSNKDFIEIEIANFNGDIDKVIDLINKKHPDMVKYMSIDRTQPEILIEIPKAGFNLSIIKFNDEINSIAEASVDIFTLDFDKPEQRRYW